MRLPLTPPAPLSPRAGRGRDYERAGHDRPLLGVSDTPTIAPRLRLGERGESSASVVWCGALIAAIKASLRVAGFARTIGWIHWQTDDLPRRRIEPASVIDPLAHAVALAAALYPGRAQCLEQSLLLYYLLRRRGIEAHFRLGVQPHPFGAHAWVECGGVPINNVPEHVRHFAPMPEGRG